MMWFLHNDRTAPGAAQELLHTLQRGFGFVPNLFAKMAESPRALQAYLGLRAHFEQGALSPAEQQVVALAAAVELNSEFCVGAHSFAARNVVKLRPDVLQALRDGRELPDPKLNVLANFTRELVRQNGAVDEGDLKVFFAAGYLKQHVLDVVLGVTLKTFASYVGQIVNAPLNEQFEPERWSPPSRGARLAWRQEFADLEATVRRH